MMIRTSGVSAPTRTGLSNGWIAVLFFIGCEAVLFGSLVSAFVFLRLGGVAWPPAGLARLEPTFATINMLVLLVSGLIAYGGELAIERYRVTLAEKLLLGASVLGLFFFGGQIYEFGALFGNGITPGNSIYGSLFYTMIGFHAFHVLSGIIWLVAVWNSARQAHQTPESHFGVKSATLYWAMVAVVWIVFYLLLYIV